MAKALALLLLASWAGAAQPAASKTAEPPRVLVAKLSGIISPPSSEFLRNAIDRAERDRREALVIELDTPGGLDASMREIVKAILGAQVPVIVFVHPSGARAASAGVFITMAAHVAAMTPGTNIGAAHPVALGAPSPQGQGKDQKPDKIMEEKVTNDASAYLQAIAARRGRNPEWAQWVVARSSSVPSAEAVRLKIVDLEANALPELLAAVDGRKLADLGRVLRTKGAVVERFEMTRRQRWLSKVADPNVAMLLMTIGVSGLLIELYSPGLVLPGVVGVVALVLAFYSFETLSADYAGIILIFLGLLFLLLEIKITSFGLLALAGIASVGFGAMMAFRAVPGVSWGALGASAATILAVTLALIAIAVRAMRARPEVGVQGMIGRRGVAATALEPRGTVRLGDELWRAVAPGPLPAGTEIVVESVEGLTVRVRKA